MTAQWSRRALLAALAASTAGCIGDGEPPTPDGTRAPTDLHQRTPTRADDESTAEAPSPTENGSTPSDEFERLPADHPALSWAVRVPGAIYEPPAIDAERGRVYVGTGERSIHTPTGGTSGPAGRFFSLDANGGVAWRTETEAPTTQRPVVHDGRVHAVTGRSNGYTGQDQRITAFAPDGEVRWRASPTPTGFLDVVAARGGTLFVGTGDDAVSGSGESLFAIGSDGEVQWEREAGDARGATFADGALLYSSGGMALDAYDPATGDRQWRVPGEPIGNASSRIAAFGGRCFVESHEETDRGYPLVARSLADGSELWRYDAAPASGENFVPTGVADAGPALDDGAPDDLLVGTEYGGTVFALSGDGSEAWTASADAQTTRGLAVGNAVYVGDSDGTVYALEAADGTERWRASVPGSASVTLLENGVLAQGSTDGGEVLAAFDAEGRERWRYESDRNLNRPVVAGDRVYASADDGTVLAFAEGDG